MIRREERTKPTMAAAAGGASGNQGGGIEREKDQSAIMAGCFVQSTRRPEP